MTDVSLSCFAYDVVAVHSFYFSVSVGIVVLNTLSLNKHLQCKQLASTM